MFEDIHSRLLGSYFRSSFQSAGPLHEIVSWPLFVLQTISLTFKQKLHLDPHRKLFINSFHTTGPFVCPMKTSETQRYKQRPVVREWLRNPAIELGKGIGKQKNYLISFYLVGNVFTSHSEMFSRPFSLLGTLKPPLSISVEFEHIWACLITPNLRH